MIAFQTAEEVFKVCSCSVYCKLTASEIRFRFRFPEIITFVAYNLKYIWFECNILYYKINWWIPALTNGILTFVMNI